MNFTLIHVLNITGRSPDLESTTHTPSRLPSGLDTSLLIYSGGSVRESHPVPYSPFWGTFNVVYLVNRILIYGG